MKVNVRARGRARMIMRQSGNFRLLLSRNAALISLPEMLEQVMGRCLSMMRLSGSGVSAAVAR